MPRKSPRFQCYLERLSSELLASICLELDLISLSNLRQVSKAWKSFVDSDVTLRQICVREGLLKPTQRIEDVRGPLAKDSELSDRGLFSNLRWKGYKQDELSSYWSLVRAATARYKGLPFHQGHPTRRRHYIFRGTETRKEWQLLSPTGPYDGIYNIGVRDLKIDHLNRLLITTPHRDYFDDNDYDDSLRFTDLDSGKSVSVAGYPNPSGSGFQVSQGSLVTREGKQFKVRRINRFEHAQDGRPSSEVRLDEVASIPCSRSITMFCVRLPLLIALTSRLRLLVYDVRQDEVLRSIDVSPSGSQGRSAWSPVNVEVDNGYYFTLLAGQYTSTPDWRLQVFSRVEPDHLVWQSDDAKLRELTAATKCRKHIYFNSDTLQRRDNAGHWDQSATVHEWPASSSDAEVEVEGKIRFLNRNAERNPFAPLWVVDDTPHGLGLDVKTDSLCVLSGTSLTIFRDYTEMLSRGSEQPSGQPTVLYFACSGPNEELRQLHVASGHAVFNIDGKFILVGLRGVLAGRVEESVVRYQPPLVKRGFDDDMDDCSAIHLDETSLAVQGVEPSASGYYDGHDGTSVTIFDFAELGKLNSSSTATPQEKNASIEFVWKEKTESHEEEQEVYFGDSFYSSMY